MSTTRIECSRPSGKNSLSIPAASNPRREAVGGLIDERAQEILAEVLDYPGVPRSLRSLDATQPLLPIVPIRYALGDLRFEYSPR
jgi:hypothetical protein